jgi:hypothetical protein
MVVIVAEEVVQEYVEEEVEQQVEQEEVEQEEVEQEEVEQEEVEEVVAKVKKARKARKAKVEKVPEPDEDDTDETHSESDDSKRAPKEGRKPFNLERIKEALDSGKHDKAVKLLEKYMSKFGVGGRKPKTDRPKKEPNAYQLFIRDAMVKVRETAAAEVRVMNGKEVMIAAVAIWNKHKAEMVEK